MITGFTGKRAHALLLLTALLPLCASALAQEPARTAWQALADESTAVVVGTLTGPEQSVERGNERTPQLLRQADGSYRTRLRDPKEYTVGGLWRLSVEEVVKGDGRVAPGGTVDVFHQGQLADAQAGRQYLLFLHAPIIRADIEDPVNGWRKLYGTILSRPDSNDEAPFDPSNAYSVSFAPRSSPASAALEVTRLNAAEVETIKNQLRAQGMPTARIVAPIAGELVRGIVTLSAAAADDVGVLGVQFKVDERDLGAEIMPSGTGPIGLTWDTTTIADGNHSVVAVARDGAGNRASSASVPFIIDNTPPVLRLTVRPAWLWPADRRLVPVVVEVTVADARDPKPQVLLDSITCEERGGTVQAGVPENGLPCASPLNVVGAKPGSDDREFELRAMQRRPGLIRVYTITYVARDAAGNQTTASAIVQVRSPPAPAAPTK